jgi:hypothetical protein
MELAVAVETEVRELHEFFQAWFNGAVPCSESELQRVRQSWVDPFVLTDPDGARLSPSTLIRDLYSQHAAFPKLRIQIDAFSCETIERSLVARYVESHIDGAKVDRRECEAHFVAAASFPNGVRWLKVDERRKCEDAL